MCSGTKHFLLHDSTVSSHQMHWTSFQGHYNTLKDKRGEGLFISFSTLFMTLNKLKYKP